MLLAMLNAAWLKHLSGPLFADSGLLLHRDCRVRRAAFFHLRGGSDRCDRLGNLFLYADWAAFGDDFALVNPDLHADAAERGVCFGEPVVDVGAKGVTRHTALRLIFAAGHFGATEAAGDGHAATLGATLHRALDRLLDGAAEGHAALQLVRYRAGDQVGVELRSSNLLDVHADPPAGELLQRVAQVFDLGAAAADYD